MTVRHSMLAVGAVLVLGMAIYLVREVSRTPVAAQADHAPSSPPREVPAPPPPSPSPSPSPSAHAAASTQPERRSPNHDRPVGEAQPERVMPTGPNPKLDAIMAEANRAYDQGEFDEAKQIAQKVLERSPGNVRMLRIIVSSECIAGDSAEAQKYFVQLPESDRAQMRTRCDRYGVTFKDP